MIQILLVYIVDIHFRLEPATHIQKHFNDIVLLYWQTSTIIILFVIMIIVIVYAEVMIYRCDNDDLIVIFMMIWILIWLFWFDYFE